MILATRHGQVAREATLGALMQVNGMQLRGGDALTSASPSDIAGLPAFQQGIRIAAQAIAKHDLTVFRGPVQARQTVTSTWQARFFANPPNERDTWFFTWEGTEASLTARNNAYWLKGHDLLTGRVNRVQVCHPDAVKPRWNAAAKRAEYQVLQDDGTWSDWLTSAEVLHFRAGAPSPGAIVAPSPIELHRHSWATAVAKQRAEQSVYQKGTKRAVAVLYPDTVTPEQALRWREVYLDSQADSDVKVFGGNPRVEAIGLSFQDQQFVETQQFSIEDAGRILGVMPSLLWAASFRGDKPLTPEHEEDRWYRYGLTPRRSRLEQTVAADPDFFGVGARDYPLLTADRIRADRDTEVQSQVRLVQAGIVVPDTAAQELGYPPLPDGLGQIVQITPVGGAPNEPAPAPQQAVLAPVTIVERDRFDGLASEVGAAVRDAVRAAVERPVHVELRGAREQSSPTTIENHIHVPEQAAAVVNVAAPQVENHVHVPEQPAPEVHVEVAAAEVRVELPEQPAPTVNVNVPAESPKKLVLERNPQGWIKGATIEEAD